MFSSGPYVSALWTLVVSTKEPAFFTAPNDDVTAVGARELHSGLSWKNYSAAPVAPWHSDILSLTQTVDPIFRGDPVGPEKFLS